MQYKLIVAICAYNEGQFISNTIESLLARVKDIDVIEIMDGAWKNGGDSAKSTDDTKQIVESVAKLHDCKIIFRESDEIFENESAKRNHQLETIQKEYGHDPHWIFVVDADEKVGFATGESELYLKDYLSNLPFIGCLKTYHYGEKQFTFVPRFIPGGMGIHYHEHLRMELHTANHLIKIPYSFNMQKDTFGQWYIGETLPTEIFKIDNYFIVNFIKQRHQKRKVEAFTYHQVMDIKEKGYDKECEYQQSLKTTEDLYQ